MASLIVLRISRLFATHSNRVSSVYKPGIRCCSIHRKYCTVLAEPHIEGTEKVYAENIQTLVNDISRLTLIEVADLNELLKKTLNIPDTPMMSMGAMQAGKAQTQEEDEEQAPAAAVQTSFTVKLLKFDPTKKVAVIKEIKSLVEGMNLVQAKKFVESVPQPVQTDLGKDEAEKLKLTLEAAGGEVEIV